MRLPSSVSRIWRLAALGLFASSPIAMAAEPQPSEGWLLPYTLQLSANATEFALPLGRAMELGLDLTPVRDPLSLRAAAAPVKIVGATLGGNAMGRCLASNAAGVASCDSSAAFIDAYSVGAQWSPSRRFSLSLDYFSRPVLIDSPTQSIAVVTKSLALSSRPGTAPWQTDLGTAEGLDVNMAMALPFANLGQLALGLEVAKILPEADRGTLLAEPYTRAVMDLGWANGDFSGSLVSRYLSDENAKELQRSWTSLDLNLAWRMPWSGSFSVGARNLLNSEAPRIGGLATESFESGLGDALGRVPYVRYQQDL